MIILNHQEISDVLLRDDPEKCDRTNHALSAIAHLVGVGDESLIIPTSGRGEGVAAIFQSVLFSEGIGFGKNHMMTISTEEADILLTLERFHKYGIEPQVATVNSEGRLTRDILDLHAGPRLSLLSLSWASRHTGVVQPIWEISEYCKENGILLHVDVSDVAGKLFLSCGDLPIDFITLEGSRIGGPVGTGALIVRKDRALEPLIPSGEGGGVRGGPVDVEGIIKLGDAARRAHANLQHVCMETARLKHLFEQEILKQIPHSHILFDTSDRLPTTTAIAFEGIHFESLLFHLNERGVLASFGGGNAQRLDHILGVCGVIPELARGAVSFCLSHETTHEQLKQVVNMLGEVVSHLRKVAGPLVEQSNV